MKQIYLTAVCLLIPVLTFAYPVHPTINPQHSNASFSWKLDSSFQLPDAIQAIAIDGKDQGVRNY